MAKAAAPEGAPPQEILKLGAAIWSKLTPKQKSTWEKRAADEKRNATKAMHTQDQLRVAKERELALRRLLAGLKGGADSALQLADELWPGDCAENAELFAGLHTLHVPSLRQSIGQAPVAGTKRQQGQKRVAEAINLF